MYTKAQFLSSLRTETMIIKHLAKQLPAGQEEYRPTPGQRSTLELLRYLPICALASARFLIEGNFDFWAEMEAVSNAVTPATFAKAMDRQVKAITKLLDGVSEASLKRKLVKSWDSNRPKPMGEALIDIGLKQLTAYRMQLFLYAKASGASSLGTSDVWKGKTAKPAKKKAASA